MGLRNLYGSRNGNKLGILLRLIQLSNCRKDKNRFHNNKTNNKSEKYYPDRIIKENICINNSILMKINRLYIMRDNLQTKPHKTTISIKIHHSYLITIVIN